MLAFGAGLIARGDLLHRRRTALSPRRHQPWLGRKPRSAPPARLDESRPRSRRGRARRASSSSIPTLLRRRLLAKPRAADQSRRRWGCRTRASPSPLTDGVRLVRLVRAFPQRSCDRARARRRRRPPGNHPSRPRCSRRRGYGVLLYDARGRGESGGHENAFGWQWDRDVRGAVSFLPSRGIHRHRPARPLHRRRSGRHRGSVRPTRRSGRRRWPPRTAPPPTPATSRSAIGSRSSPPLPSPASKSGSLRGQAQPRPLIESRARRRADATAAADRHRRFRARIRPGLHPRHEGAALGIADKRAHEGLETILAPTRIAFSHSSTGVSRRGVVPRRHPPYRAERRGRDARSARIRDSRAEENSRAGWNRGIAGSI